MFFIARTVAAMWTGSCGSKRTTEMRERRESDMRENESEQPVWLVPVTPKIDEFSGGTGHHELAAATSPAGNDLVDEDVEEELRRAMVDVQRRVQLIARGRRAPPRVHGELVVPAFDLSHGDAARLRNEQESRVAISGNGVELHAVAVDGRGIVVELVLGEDGYEQALRCRHVDLHEHCPGRWAQDGDRGVWSACALPRELRAPIVRLAEPQRGTERRCRAAGRWATGGCG